MWLFEILAIPRIAIGIPGNLKVSWVSRKSLEGEIYSNKKEKQRVKKFQ